ncbi:MAG TPA: hypothetical protein VGA15_02245 [Bradyrhizobium sp.]
MMILYGFGGFRPFWRAQVWAVEHLISVNCASGDFRWAIAALVLRWFGVLEAFAQKQLASLARTVMGRAWQGARFAAHMTDADTMVATGGS